MKALITGITGQDGSYLAELLLDKGYEVHGIVRRHAIENNRFNNIKNILDKITLHEGDMCDESSIFKTIHNLQPDEVYNLSAQSHVKVSSDTPIYTSKVNGIAVVSLLEAIRQIKPNCKFYQASSSEMFGNSVDDDGFQRETTTMNPVSPYACAKLYGYHIVRHYRNAYNIFACNGILMNHESPRRGESFVTQKIVRAAINIKYGRQDKLMLGNLDAYRDWSHAKDMVKGMHLIMQHNIPDDFLLASGESHSVSEFCDFTFEYLGMDYRDYVEIDPKFYRAQELTFLRGDCTKAKTLLGWKQEYNLKSLIADMIEAQL